MPRSLVRRGGGTGGSCTHHEHGCPIQASLGWDTTNPHVGFVILSGDRSPRRAIRVEGSAVAFSRLPPTTNKGCPIQAPLGWDTTNPAVASTVSSWSIAKDLQLLFCALPPTTTRGAPSKLRLGGIPRTPLIRHCHPERRSLAAASDQSRRICGCFFSPPTHHEPGCPIQASLGWDTTNPTCRLCHPDQGEASAVASSALIPPRKRVPHPRRVLVVAARVGSHGHSTGRNPPRREGRR